jgi:Ni/Co efflux regulator RcnB
MKKLTLLLIAAAVFCSPLLVTKAEAGQGRAVKHTLKVKHAKAHHHHQHHKHHKQA